MLGTLKVPAPHREVAELRTLLEVAKKLGATTALQPLLEQIALAATTVLDCARASVFIYDAARHELYSRVAMDTGEIRFPADRGLAGDCVRCNQVVNVPDAYADKRFNRDIDIKTGFRTESVLCLPLCNHAGKLVGVLQVLNKRGGPFSSRDEELSLAFGSLVGVALQRQMLLEEYETKQKLMRDLALARQIQQSLLPKKDPTIAGFDIAGFNIPADATGGDCYDFFPAEDGRLGIIIADASGHGIGPALVVAQYRAMVRSGALYEDAMFERLNRINDLLLNDTPDGMFVTSFLGLLNPATFTVQYVSAGQGPLLVYRHALKEVFEFGAVTCPLGIVQPLPDEEVPVLHFESGDALILITDGFFEWIGPDREQFGIERVKQLIISNAAASSRELITKLYESVLEFGAGTPQQDDLTAIVVKRL
jgi:phosphoserine phosphatase